MVGYKKPRVALLVHQLVAQGYWGIMRKSSRSHLTHPESGEQNQHGLQRLGLYSSVRLLSKIGILKRWQYTLNWKTVKRGFFAVQKSFVPLTNLNNSCIIQLLGNKIIFKEVRYVAF
jgi:hypothetical protein